MSSHHIVLEKQEPALLIMSLEFNSEYFGQLLEWSPTIIVHAPLYEYADSLGIKIDVVITPDADFACQHGTSIISSEKNPLEDGLKFLVGEQYPSVNIITDQFMVKDYSMYVDHINMVIYMENKKIFPIRSGFSKWRAKGEQVLLLQEVKNLGISGLIPTSKHEFETEKDGFYTLNFEHDFIFIAETI